MAGAPANTPSEKADRKKRAQQWKRLRKRNFLSQKHLSELLDVSHATVWLIENELVTPRYKILATFEALKKQYDREARA